MAEVRGLIHCVHNVVVAVHPLVQRLLHLVSAARTSGVQLTGPGGLLTGLTKQVLETALDVEMTEHVGHERRERSGAGNVRNGSSEDGAQRRR